MEERDESKPMAHNGYSDDKERPTPPVWAVPARRSDTVGLLAWQLVGVDGKTPDFTAAGRLVDALMDEGDHAQAMAIRRSLAQLVEDVRDVSNDRTRVKNLMRGRLERTREAVSHLLYDFDSAMGVLVHAAEIANTPDAPMEDQTAEAKFVRAVVGYRSRGEHVRLPDGRSGIVVEERGDDNRSRILLD